MTDPSAGFDSAEQRPHVLDGVRRISIVPGITQLSLHVDDAQKAFEQVKAAGLPLLTELIDAAPIGVKAFFTEDPDGNLIEFVEAGWA
jgi:catechol 2,3-dioxygenase-like lactoylglutathione lyase family enzyme